MKESKYLYNQGYCNAEDVLEKGFSVFRIKKYEITEVSQWSKCKDYYIEDYGHVEEQQIDKEEGFRFGSLQGEKGHYAEFWSFTESEEIMKCFKEEVIKCYKNNIKKYEEMIAKAKFDISEIKIQDGGIK